MSIYWGWCVDVIRACVEWTWGGAPGTSGSLREANSKRLVCFVGNIGSRMLSDMRHEPLAAPSPRVLLYESVTQGPGDGNPVSAVDLGTIIPGARPLQQARLDARMRTRRTLRGSNPPCCKLPPFLHARAVLNAAARAVVDACSVDPPRQEWESFVPN